MVAVEVARSLRRPVHRRQTSKVPVGVALLLAGRADERLGNIGLWLPFPPVGWLWRGSSRLGQAQSREAGQDGGQDEPADPGSLRRVHQSRYPYDKGDDRKGKTVLDLKTHLETSLNGRFPGAPGG